MIVEEIPELLQRRFDVAVCAFDQRVHCTADVVAEFGRHVCNREARSGAFFQPLGSLTARLAAPPGVEEGRHSGSIGRRSRAVHPSRVYPVFVELPQRVEDFIRRRELIPRGGEVTCLVSGGADSTCAWHVLRALGYTVSALHVNHGLRGAESEEDARFCAEHFDAEIVDGRGGSTEDELRDIRYSFARDRLRATGHTATDQVETVLYRLASSGVPGGIKPKREDGVVRPLLEVWREETEAYCRAEGLDYRVDASNRDTKRGLIREEILPRLRELHPAAEKNLLRLGEERPSALDDLLP